MTLARLFAAAATIAIFGCGGTYTVTGPDANTSLEEVARRITGGRADIHTSGTGEDRVTVLSLTVDSLRYRRSDPDSVGALPMEQISRIRRPAPVGSTVVGALLGLTAGALVGGAIAYAADPPSRTLSLSGPKKEQSSLPAFALIAGVLAGTTTGIIVGGEPTTYEFPFPPSPESVANGAEPKAAGFPPGTELFMVEVSRLIAETPTTVTFRWQGRPLTLPRNAITIGRTDDGRYQLLVPKVLLDGR